MLPESRLGQLPLYVVGLGWSFWLGLVPYRGPLVAALYLARNGILECVIFPVLIPAEAPLVA